ncbi:PREDICTED: zinc finger protein ZFAT isoform X2 [Poecilia mexicana]|uniref:zinc finger protein ZFAT isoform X2 n=1 Tax=Poecilia mexicana TaxID=48701 RepID=UPI00072DC806|nr:PREDICTED: zinc finger protein ZFAT isoform X2 [Poecilia mexicana]
MNGEKAAGSVFMCRLCNLFSPSHSQLLAHCSKNHPQYESPDSIITALQPLITEPVEKLLDNPIKRKRGRPKGSTKKLQGDLMDQTTVAAQSAEENLKGKESNNKNNGQQQCGLVKDGESQDGALGRECRICHRTFSNKRQILKHICLREEDEEDDVQQHDEALLGITSGAEEDVGSRGTDSNQTKQKPTRSGLKRQKDTSSSNLTSVNRVCSERGKTTGQKKTLVNVVLTEDKILPGVCKMVTVENTSAERESSATQGQHQLLASGGTACENNQTPQEELSSNLKSGTTASTSKGFQEYSIKQDAANLPQSKLKIFACEFCNKIFKFRHSLVAHLRTHTKEKPFQCPHCDYASAIKANLNVHLRKHTGEKFSCDHCAFSCLSPGHLKVHIERVHLKMKQHCSFCEKKYSDVKNLLKHMETRHNLKDSAVLQTYQQLRLKTRQGLRQLLYHCPTCNRRFKNQQERERHLLIHGPQPPFACLLCDHTATKMVALTAHVRKHLFLYVCSVCSKKLVSSQRLRGHLEESHPELDMEQTFINCINISYYLILPEGGGGSEVAGGKEREATFKEGENAGTKVEGNKGPGGDEEELRNDGKQQQEEEQTQSVQMMEEEKGKEDRLSIGGAQKDSQDKSNEEAVEEKLLNSSACVSAADAHAEKNDSSSSPDGVHSSSLKDRTQENTQPDVVNSSAVCSTVSSSSSGVSNSSDLPGETQSSSASQVESSQTSPTEKSAFEQVFSSLQKTRLDMETYQRLRKIYGDLECQYCGKLFWYKVHYNVHVRTHTKEHLHYCSKCSYSSITKSSLKRHQIQKHSGLLLPCSSPGCKYSTPDKYKLQAHMRTQHEQESCAVCPICQRTYPQHRLKHHLKSSHPDKVPVGGKGPMVQRAEKCPYCDSYFLKNSSDFQQHIWAHQGLKPYVCSVCSYSSCNRSNLKTHMNRHSSEKHHLCDHCGKKFKSKLTLKSHRLNHTDEGKRFQCSECPFTSVFKPSLLRHMEQHAKFKPFRCAHCHYSCNIAGALKRHFNIKHPEETYENAGLGLPNSETLKQQGGMKCPECEFVYGTKWELTRHLKTKHNLKVVEGNWEVAEEAEAQYVSVENEEHLTEAPLAVLEDNGNVQQIAELSSETHNAVASVVAMAPGTVTVVQQVQVAQDHEVGDCSNQLMVVNADEGLDGNQVMVVEDGHGLDALTVLTQGENTHHYIVYIQEQTVEIN